LRTNGALARDDHSFRVFVQRQDMTGADRAWANHCEIGDVVRYSRGIKAVGIEAGSYVTVVGVQPASNLLSLENEAGDRITYDPRRFSGVSVYRGVTHEFTAGDRIQFTAPDKQLGVANRDLAVIESIAPDGRVSARLDANREIEFNAANHRHLLLGYDLVNRFGRRLESGHWDRPEMGSLVTADWRWCPAWREGKYWRPWQLSCSKP
jgi:hypothetical protein